MACIRYKLLLLLYIIGYGFNGCSGENKYQYRYDQKAGKRNIKRNATSSSAINMRIFHLTIAGIIHGKHEI